MGIRNTSMAETTTTFCDINHAVQIGLNEANVWQKLFKFYYTETFSMNKMILTNYN